MSLEVRGISNIKNTLKATRTKAEQFENYLVLIARDISANILKRTRNNQDVNGQCFKPYQKSYAKYKVENAYQAFRSKIPNLSFTGQMLRAMSVQKITNGARIYFNSEEEAQKAYWHNNGTGVPKREFFGLSKLNLNYIAERIKNYWSKK